MVKASHIFVFASLSQSSPLKYQSSFIPISVLSLSFRIRHYLICSSVKVHAGQTCLLAQCSADKENKIAPEKVFQFKP